MIWVDEQLNPRLAVWISGSFGEEAVAVRDLDFASASDRKIFDAARDANATVMTKDVDFVNLLERLGPPPKVIWITCGNTSDVVLRDSLTKTLPDALRMLKTGDNLVEISGP